MDFKQALKSFFAGEVDFAGVQRALYESVQREPASAAEIVALLDRLYRAGRLPPQIHSALRTQVIAQFQGPPTQGGPAAPSVPPAGPPPQPGDSTGRPTGLGAPSIGEAGPVTRPPASPPTAGQNTDEEAGDDRTRIRMPPAPGGPQAEEPTTIRPAGTSPPTGGSATGRSVTGASTTGSRSSSSWGHPERWDHDAGDAEVGTGSVIKDRFVLEALIGRGGMGVVYKARDLRKEEAQDRNPHVALKVLSEEFKKHPDSLKALQREARKAQDLAHPNIVNVFDFDRDRSTVFMTMELLEGEPLDKVIKRHAMTGMPWHDARPIIRHLSLALDYAHGKGVVHSDFKPGNAFLTNERNDRNERIVKVFDFGIARAAKRPDDAEGEKTLFDTATLGAMTPSYASCEMLDGEEPDARDDIYALAVTAYELLAGKHPFDRKKATTARSDNRIPARPAGMPRYRYKALLHGLAFERDKRVARANQFFDELFPKRRVTIGAAVGAVTIIALLTVMAWDRIPGWVQKRELERIATQIASQQRDEVAEAVDNALQLDVARRNTLLTNYAVRQPLIEHFSKQIDTSFQPASGAYDLPAAQRELDRLLTLLPTDIAADNLREVVDERRREFLQVVDRQFNENLDALRLRRDETQPDIWEVIDKLNQADPAHPLLDDTRLSQAYAREAERALQSRDVTMADQLVALGREYAALGQSVAGDPALDDLVARIDNVRDALAREQQRQQTEQFVAQRIPQLVDRAAVDEVREKLKLLTDIAPDSTVLARARASAEPVVEASIAQQIAARSFDEALALVSDYRSSLGANWADRQRTVIAGQRTRLEQQLASLWQAFTQAIKAGRLDDPGSGALSLLQSLQAAGADTAEVNNGRDQIAQVWLERARQEREQGNWGRAKEMVDRGRVVTPSAALAQQLDGEELAIQNREQIAEEERWQQAIADLKTEFASSLAADQPNVPVLLSTLERLEATLTESGQSDVLQTEGVGRIQGAVARRANALEQQGNLDSALDVIAKAITALTTRGKPAGMLASLQDRLERDKETLLADARQREIEGVVAKIRQLFTAVSYSESMHVELRGLLDSIGKDSPTTAREQRRYAALKYVGKAAERRGEEIFSDAKVLLERAAELAPDLPELEAEQGRFRLAQAAFDQARQASQRVAEIEGLKNSFTAQVRANNTDAAIDTQKQLASKLAREDEFLTQFAPAELADAFGRIAESHAKRGRFSSALGAIGKALDYRPDEPQFAASQAQYQLELDRQSVQQAMRSGSANDIARTADLVARIRATAGFDEFERQAAQTLAARIRAGAADAESLRTAAGRIFPGNTIIANIAIVAPKPDFEADARRILETIRTGGADAITQSRAAVDRLRSESGYRGFAQLRSQAETLLTARRDDAKDTDIALASGFHEAGRTLFPESTVFAAQFPAPRIVDNCKPFMAGKGKSPRFRCLDDLSAGGKGPKLVVVGDGTFAITAYEISVGDYNEYCRNTGACQPRDSDKLPLANVSVAEASKYAAWLTENSGHVYRLPTDREWLKAAESGGVQPQWNFNCRFVQGSIEKGGIPVRHDTGAPNEWGLYNYLGNVQEWVWTGPGKYAARGGSFDNEWTDCNLQYFVEHDGGPDATTGFRLVRQMTTVTGAAR